MPIVTATAVLKSNPTEATSRDMIAVIQRSGARMNELIERNLDIARGQAGGRSAAPSRPPSELATGFQQIIHRFRTDSSAQRIEAQVELKAPIVCDEAASRADADEPDLERHCFASMARARCMCGPPAMSQADACRDE